MRDADEIIRRNANRLLAEAAQKAEADGRLITESIIAGRMAATLGMKSKSVAKQLDRYLHQNHVWRIDYVEALARALGVSLADMFTPHPDGRRVPEATVSQLYAGLAARISHQDSKLLVRRLHQLLDHPPLYALGLSLLATIIDAETREAAHLEVHALVSRSDAWEQKRPNLRGKRIGDKKSK